MTEFCKIEWTGDGSARLSGALTFETVPDLFLEVERHPGAAPRELDLSGVRAADSAGLALLLEWQATLNSAGGGLSVTAAPESLLQLARLAEADQVLQISGGSTDR